MVVEADVGGGHREEEHIPVDAAVEGEVGPLRVDRLVGAVVDVHDEHVVVAQRLGEGDAERRVAAFMGRQQGSVEMDLRAGVDAAELQPDVPVRVGGREPDGVGAGAATVVVAAVLAIDRVPGVGQVDRLARLG